MSPFLLSSDPTGGFDNVGPISDYTLVNARIGITSDTGGWRAILWGRNIFNQYYFPSAFLGNGTFARINGLPVTYGVTVGYDF